MGQSKNRNDNPDTAKNEPQSTRPRIVNQPGDEQQAQPLDDDPPTNLVLRQQSQPSQPSQPSQAVVDPQPIVRPSFMQKPEIPHPEISSGPSIFGRGPIVRPWTSPPVDDSPSVDDDARAASAVRPRYVGGAPKMSDLDKAKETYRQLMSMTPHDENGRVKSALYGGLQGLAKSFQEPVRGWGDFAGRLGGGIGGAVGGAVNPSFDEQQRHDLELARAGRDVAMLQEQEAQDTSDKLRKAQIANIDEDNLRNADNAEAKREADAEKAAETRRADFYRRHPFFYPAKATLAQKRELASFGETPDSIGEYDFTNPTFKTVGGTMYSFNRDTGKLEDSGISDKTKSIVDYTVVDPRSGFESTFSTTRDKEARLKISLAAAGYKEPDRAQSSEVADGRRHGPQVVEAAKQKLGQEGKRLKMEQQKIDDARARGEKVDPRAEQRLKDRRLKLRKYIQDNVLDIRERDELLRELDQ